MTCYVALIFNLSQWWFFDLAAVYRDGTTRVKSASGRRINRRRHIAFENDSALLCSGIGNRNGAQESLCVRMFWRKTNLCACSYLDQLPPILQERFQPEVFLFRFPLGLKMQINPDTPRK